MLFLLQILNLIFCADFLENKKSGLILLTYEQENEKCFACEIIRKEMDSKNIPYEEINFFANLELGARFFTILFPSIFYKRVENDIVTFYYVQYSDIVDGEFNSKYRKISGIFSPNSTFSLFIGKFFSLTFPIYLQLKTYADKIPMYIVVLFGSLLFIYFMKTFMIRSSLKKKIE